jgi:hypothetical protein
MNEPEAIALLRELATQAEILVKMLRDTGRAPPCFDLKGLAEAKKFLDPHNRGPQ